MKHNDKSQEIGSTPAAERHITAAIRSLRAALKCRTSGLTRDRIEQAIASVEIDR